MRLTTNVTPKQRSQVVFAWLPVFAFDGKNIGIAWLEYVTRESLDGFDGFRHTIIHKSS